VILQATDSEWWEYKNAFKQASITVCFLCPDYVKEKSAEKYQKSKNPE